MAMSEPQMTEKTGVSLGLVMSLVGICSMSVGSFAWLKSDVAALKDDAAALKNDAAERAVLVRRMDRLELLICATEDKNRAMVCDQLRKTPQ
jgi:hypothetical protein